MSPTGEPKQKLPCWIELHILAWEERDDRRDHVALREEAVRMRSALATLGYKPEEIRVRIEGEWM